MKKIIMLAILISFAFGQITESEATTEEERYFPIESVAVVETEFEMTFELEPIKIWHLLEYAEECYNDSTEDFYVRVLDSVEIIYFNHRKPTFKGFIEWIKNRSK